MVIVHRRNLKKKKIGVLMGGMSRERDISLKTGKAVETALREEGFIVTSIDVDKNLAQRLRDEYVDVAFIALHGTYGEDGTVQGLLEILGIPYTGSGVLSSALALNKIKTKQIFSYYRIPTPKWSIMDKSKFNQEVVASLDIEYPVVVKPSCQGSALGTSIVHGRQDFEKALKEAFSYDHEILIEQYIKGMEVTVGIIDNETLPLVEIVSENSFYDWQAKYEEGKSRHIIPARLPGRFVRIVQDLAIQAHQALGCRGVTRVDMLIEGTPDKYKKTYVLEVNTVPGMTQTSLLPDAARAAGISFNELVTIILKLALV